MNFVEENVPFVVVLSNREKLSCGVFEPYMIVGHIRVGFGTFICEGG